MSNIKFIYHYCFLKQTSSGLSYTDGFFERKESITSSDNAKKVHKEIAKATNNEDSVLLSLTVVGKEVQNERER